MDSFDKTVQNMTAFSFDSITLNDDDIESEIGGLAEPTGVATSGNLKPYVPGKTNSFPTSTPKPTPAAPPNNTPASEQKPQPTVQPNTPPVSINPTPSVKQEATKEQPKNQQVNNPTVPPQGKEQEQRQKQEQGKPQEQTKVEPPTSPQVKNTPQPSVNLYAEESEGPKINIGNKPQPQPTVNTQQVEDKSTAQKQPIAQPSTEQVSPKMENQKPKEQSKAKVKEPASVTQAVQDEEYGYNEDEQEVITESVDEWEKKSQPKKGLLNGIPPFVLRMLRNIGVLLLVIAMIVGIVSVYYVITGKRTLENQNTTEQKLDISSIPQTTESSDSSDDSDSFMEWYNSNGILGQDFLKRRGKDGRTNHRKSVGTKHGRN